MTTGGATPGCSRYTQSPGSHLAVRGFFMRPSRIAPADRVAPAAARAARGPSGGGRAFEKRGSRAAEGGGGAGPRGVVWCMVPANSPAGSSAMAGPWNEERRRGSGGHAGGVETSSHRSGRSGGSLRAEPGARQRRHSWAPSPTAVAGGTLLMLGVLAFQWAAASVWRAFDSIESGEVVHVYRGGDGAIGRSASVWRSDRWLHGFAASAPMMPAPGRVGDLPWSDASSSSPVVSPAGAVWEARAMGRGRRVASASPTGQRWTARLRSAGWPWRIFRVDFETAGASVGTGTTGGSGGSGGSGGASGAPAGMGVFLTARPALGDVRVTRVSSGWSAGGVGGRPSALVAAAPIVSGAAFAALAVQASACFGGVWLVMWGARRRRARRWAAQGRCSACGYDLGGLAAGPGSGPETTPGDRAGRRCPECGGALTANAPPPRRRHARRVLLALAFGLGVTLGQWVLFPAWWSLRASGVVGSLLPEEEVDTKFVQGPYHRRVTAGRHWSMDWAVFGRAYDRRALLAGRSWRTGSPSAEPEPEWELERSGLSWPWGVERSSEASAPLARGAYVIRPDAWAAANLDDAVEQRVGWPWRFASGAAHRGTWEGRGGAVAAGRASTAAVLHAPTGRAEPAEVWVLPMRWEWGAFAANAAVFAAGAWVAAWGAGVVGRRRR